MEKLERSNKVSEYGRKLIITQYNTERKHQRN